MNEQEGTNPTPVEASAQAETAAANPSGSPAMDKPAYHHQLQLEQFEKSLRQDGENAYLRWGLALFHSLSDEGVEAQRRALNAPLRDALDHYNRGCLLAAEEDFQGAAREFSEAATRDPGLGEAVFNQAMALERSGDPKAARSCWNTYLEKFGDGEEANEIKQHLSSLAEA